MEDVTLGSLGWRLTSSGSKSGFLSQLFLFRVEIGFPGNGVVVDPPQSGYVLVHLG